MKNIAVETGTTSLIRKVDRRDFLRLSGLTATGLVLGLQYRCTPEKAAQLASFSPNVYLTVGSDGIVSIIAHRSEMGTGIRTGLPLVIADELEADWSRVKVVQAVGDEARYGNQNTDGSFSVRMFFTPLRKAGASARMMLEEAAAQQWKVPVSECHAQQHEVVHQPSGKKLGFGELAEAASKLTAPKDEAITLKQKADWKYIGKSTSIVDVNDIAMGKATYGLDVTLPGMKYAVIQRCPVAGGKVKSYNADKALRVTGVTKVLELESSGFPTAFPNPTGGVVVVADNTWAAIAGRKELEIEWDFGPNATYNTTDFTKEMEAKVSKKGHVRREEGSFDKALAAADHSIDSTYFIPYLAHAPMEPPCAVADVKGAYCNIWAPTQHPQNARDSVAKALKKDVSQVTVNVTLLGGAFGRKSMPDYIVEAALISQRIGSPVKVTWTREDDLTHDFFHACSVQRIRATFDKKKNVTGWEHRSIFPSIDGTVDAKATEPTWELQLGMVDMPYNIPAVSCQSYDVPVNTRIGWLRSVNNIQHAFAVGSMMDEIAAYRKVDPVQNLLELIGPDRHIPFDKMVQAFGNYGEPIDQFPWSTARMKNVIKLAAEKSGWSKSLPKGHGMGIYAHCSFLTYVACVVHVAVDDQGISIPEVHYAVDCGTVVNRNSVINQFEGGAVFASGLALKGGITFKDGRSEQTNFDKFQVARMKDAPADIQVHLVESDEKPTGVGEPPVPPFAPALANALFAATGKRSRKLPVDVVVG